MPSRWPCPRKLHVNVMAEGLERRPGLIPVTVLERRASAFCTHLTVSGGDRALFDRRASTDLEGTRAQTW